VALSYFFFRLFVRSILSVFALTFGLVIGSGVCGVQLWGEVYSLGTGLESLYWQTAAFCVLSAFCFLLSAICYLLPAVAVKE